MKTLFIAFLMGLTLTSSAFATPEEQVSSNVLNSFNYNFKEASGVTWTVKKEFTKATFIMDGVKQEAFYKPNGDLIGISKNISLDKLPTFAKRCFAKRYPGYIVKEAIRFEGIDEGAYYLSAENEKDKVILKVVDNEMSVFQHTKK